MPASVAGGVPRGVHRDDLRRTLEEDGYQAWLRVIRQDPNNIRVMVGGFVNSVEYRLRFGCQ
jgi:hypothetical protein